MGAFEITAIALSAVMVTLILVGGMIKLLLWARIEWTKAELQIANLKVEKAAAERMAKGE